MLAQANSAFVVKKDVIFIILNVSHFYVGLDVKSIVVENLVFFRKLNWRGGHKLSRYFSQKPIIVLFYGTTV